MHVDIVLTLDQDTREYVILGISTRLYAAVQAHGSVLVDHAETDQAYEIYQDGDQLKAHPIYLQS